MSEKKTYCFDLDGTLCTQTDPKNYGSNSNPGQVYKEAKPLVDRIELVNELYDAGHTILIETARGTELGDVDMWREVTQHQLEEWGVKHHKLRVGVKLVADVYVDDRGMSDRHFFGISL